MSAILDFLARLLAALGLGWLKDKRGEAAIADKAVGDAAAETDEVFDDIAEQRAAEDARDRGDARAVLDRLLKRDDRPGKAGDPPSGLGGSGFPQG